MPQPEPTAERLACSLNETARLTGLPRDLLSLPRRETNQWTRERMILDAQQEGRPFMLKRRCGLDIGTGIPSASNAHDI